jgi:hypothetical protein
LSKSHRRRFYNALRKAKDQFNWTITRRGFIRGILNNNYYCPLTAIAKVENGKRFASINAEFVDIPSLKNVSRYSLLSIMAAADEPKVGKLDWEEKMMRKTIMKIVGLSPNSSSR